MPTDPAQVIRSLRLALDMSQAEFARAAGWSPSTISSWERGRAKPSRLAFKTILAFAEERGIRYRPPQTSTALVPFTPTASGVYDGATTRGPRPELRPLLYPDLVDVAIEPPPARDVSHTRDADDRRPSSGISYGDPAADRERRVHAMHVPAPRWSAEASFRVTLGARGARRTAGMPRGVIEAGVVAIAFCIALAVGLPQPIRRLLRPSASQTANASAVALHAGATRQGFVPLAPLAVAGVAAAAASRASPGTISQGGAASGDRTTIADRTTVGGMLPTSTAPSDLGARALAPPPDLARLESILAVNGSGRATFRTASDTVTLVTGDWLGSLRVAAIGADGVTLVDAAGTAHRVRLGQHLAVE